MERQTRQLLQLLSDELTDELLTCLEKEEMLEAELRREIGTSRQTITRRLRELEAWGIIRGNERPTPGKGRPPIGWSVVADWLPRFNSVVDSLVLDLLEERAARQREAVKQRTRDRVRPTAAPPEISSG